MSRYNKLKENVKSIILDIPIDRYDEYTGSTFRVFNWETCEPRNFSDRLEEMESETTDIGSANILECLDVITRDCRTVLDSSNLEIQEQIFSDAAYEVFNKIMDDLEKDLVIKQTPDYRREQFKLFVNKESKDG